MNTSDFFAFMFLLLFILGLFLTRCYRKNRYKKNYVKRPETYNYSITYENSFDPDGPFDPVTTKEELDNNVKEMESDLVSLDSAIIPSFKERSKSSKPKSAKKKSKKKPKKRK